jgi:hypothetical protein
MELPPVEIVSGIAALVSAIGTVFAALAAHRSAQSARRTEDASVEAERRASVRQIALASVDVATEAKRVESRGEAAKVAYKDLAVFTGNVGSSRLDMFTSEIDNKIAIARERAEHAKSFEKPAEKIEGAPAEETDRIQTELLASLRELTAIREELDDECAYVQGQCAQYREQVIMGQKG